jgi:hypothetical protein
MAKSGVNIAFEKEECTLPIDKIVPQREIGKDYRTGVKYKQIASSLESVGLVEALVVYPRITGDFLLLDGHIRLDILKAKSATEVRCILSTDDEAFTYNKRVNHIPPILQHYMILKALENSVSEMRLAEALSVEVKNIRQRRDLLKGICPEAIELLRHRHVTLEVFSILRKMKPVRQIEAAEHMIAGATFSTRFAKSLLAVTKPEFLVQSSRRPEVSATSRAAQEMLGKETAQLIRDLKAIEESYGADALSLTVCRGYIEKIIANPRIESHLSRKHSGLFDALKKALSDQ